MTSAIFFGFLTPSPCPKFMYWKSAKLGDFLTPPPSHAIPPLVWTSYVYAPRPHCIVRHGIAKLPDLPNRITRCRLGSFMTGLLRSLAFSLTVRDKQQRLYYKSFLSVCRPWTVGWSMNAAFKSFGNWRQHSPDRDMTNGAKRGMEWMDPWPWNHRSYTYTHNLL